MLGKLYPYQREGYDFGVAKKGRLLLADEMGLGKTLQTIALLLHFRAWPVLIVCPASLLYNWREELKKWVPSFAAHPERINVLCKPRQLPDANAHVEIISYARSIQDKMHAALKARKYQMVVCDESHKLKSRKAKRTRLLVPFLKRTRHAILLSGTPVMSRPSELFTQLVALGRPKALWEAVQAHMKNKNSTNSTGMNQPFKLFTVFHQFGMRYCNAHTDRFNHWDYRGTSNLAELNVVLKQEAMIRRLKVNVLTQLPEKRRQRYFIPTTDTSKRKIEKQVKQLQTAFQNTKKARNIREKLFLVNKHKQLVMEMYHTSAQSKIKSCVDALKDMVETICGSGRKLLIFGHHRSMLDAIEEKCIGAFIKQNPSKHYIRIDGSTKAMHRGELVDIFQTHPDCCIALLSITACGYGLTLTAASDVVFAEMYWNPGIMVQAEDRVHRIGQDKTCLMYYLVARDSFDEKLWLMLNEKMRIVSSILDGKAERMFERDDKHDIGSDGAVPPAKRVKLSAPPSTDASPSIDPFADFVLSLTT